MTGSAYYLSFQEIADIIGLDGATSLTRSFGGTRFYVRDTVGQDHPIAKVLGLELASKFAGHVATGIGGMVVEIPRGGANAFAHYRRRLREVVEHSGLTEHEIAAEMKVHGRTVRRMRALLKRERLAKAKPKVICAP